MSLPRSASPEPLDTIRNARLGGRSGLWKLGIADGVLSSISPEADGLPAVPGPQILDVGAAVVLPGFVEPHVHLDKAHTYDAVAAEGGSFGGLDDAIATTSRALVGIGTARITAGGDRLLGELAAHGVVAARAQVEINGAVGLASVAAHLELRDRWTDRVELQLVAFPQQGFERDPSARSLLEEAMRLGCDAVGGCPYVDVDQDRHLDIVFDVAARWNRPLDLHLDLTDDWQRSVLATVVSRATTTGVTVTVAHLTALATLPHDEVRRLADTIAETGIAVVVLPTTDLYLGGRAGRGPTLRGVAPLRQLFDAGVVTALGTNNVDNAFTPFGAVHPLRLAWLAGLVGHLGHPADSRRLLDAITTSAATAIGLPGRTVEIGRPADLVVLQCDDPATVVRLVPDVTHTLRRGRLTATHAAP